MPELPEVETTCRGLRPHLIGQIIKKIIVRERQLRWPIAKEINRLVELEVLQLERRAKYILLKTNKGNFIIHLGMSGRLSIKGLHTKAEKHDHVDFILEKQILRYTDPRRFGAILWTQEDPRQHKLLLTLGPEPFDQTFNTDYFVQKAQSSRLMIKELIMNAKFVVGVGNIYANEALFMAKLKPTRKAQTLSVKDCQLLIEKIQEVLKKAIAQGGTTLRDFLAPEGKPGYFSQKLRVYGRESLPCFECGQKILSVRLSQRSTFYCEYCQI